MTSNLERILEQGERLTSVDYRGETLAESSQLFKTQTSRVRQKILLQNLKYILILAVLVTVTIVAVTKVFGAKHRK
ncbi:synaptobrevin family protein [Aphelenchoides avenae]|nr:synaptobrevin family protein [Aphelenchus avenae]